MTMGKKPDSAEHEKRQQHPAAVIREADREADRQREEDAGDERAEKRRQREGEIGRGVFRDGHEMLDRIERRREEKRIDPAEPDREIPNHDEDRDGRETDRER
jgi:hypothetical protein